ncbi:MAG: hypothetical protein ACXWG1_07090 [Usitatibacter sp.]
MKPSTLSLAAAAFALAACATYTPIVHIDRPADVIVGKTTLAEVNQLMGRANNVVVDKRTQQRAYEYEFKDEFGHPARLVLVYNDGGVVASKSIETIEKD